ncbi:MAG: caspase family protein [Actinomycetota bacterium]
MRSWVARVVAGAAIIALATSGIMISHARQGHGAAPPRADASPTDATGATVPSGPSSANTGVPAGLLPVSPDGSGAGLSTYSAAGTVSSGSWISDTFPHQAAARQTSGDPASQHWALLIGLNDYEGSTTDNVGSLQDATALRDALLKLGWRSDHIMTIGNRAGTAAHIIQAIRWLASKTDGTSTVVFHYSGHENWTRTTADGDNEARDVEIWAADNRLIIDGTLGKEMNRVRASHMWIDLATCRAAGFSDAGMIKSGRILTYSSPEREYSYEDPRLHHSVFGYYMISMAIAGRKADSNHDGKVSIEEAFAYAQPRVVSYTSRAQHPVMVDKVSGSMLLTIPPKPAAPKSSPSPSSQPATAPKTCAFVCL